MAAAEFGRLAVRADSPLFSGLGVAFAAAGWCVGAGAPPRQLTRLVWQLYMYEYNTLNTIYRHDLVAMQINININLR